MRKEYWNGEDWMKWPLLNRLFPWRSSPADWKETRLTDDGKPTTDNLYFVRFSPTWLDRFISSWRCLSSQTRS